MADAGYLTIGKLVKRLESSYPDLSVSKVRFLEDEGLLTPSRTPSGYRLYSQQDIKRLETILYLQKNRFLPLSVIKERLDGGEERDSAHVDSSFTATSSLVDKTDADKLHPIERVPELIGVSVAFIRQLAEVGIVELKRSPHGRDLVEGRDFTLILAADELKRFGISPKNLRQYVNAANRESALFEQALMVYTKKAGGVEIEPSEEQKQAFSSAFSQIMGLTGQIRDLLIRKQLGRRFGDIQH